MKNRVHFIDFESNGLHKSPISFYLAVYDYKTTALGCRIESELISEYTYYFLPEKGEAWSKEAEKVHGISEDELFYLVNLQSIDAKHYSQFNKIKELMLDCTHLVCHNIEYDIQYLRGTKAGIAETFCTMKAMQKLMKRRKHTSLGSTANYYGMPYDLMKAHNPEYDIRLTKQIFERMYKDIEVHHKILEFLGI